MKEQKKERFLCCIYSHISIRENGAYHCVVDGWEDEKVKCVTNEDCEKCGRFKSRYIEYPLTIQGIENQKIDCRGLGHRCGCLCEAKPSGKEYEGKSYIGFYLGDLPIAITSSYDEETGILTNSTMNNPAIFVPELKKIIYGCESWWREIRSVEDFKGISEEEIENVWYVQMIKGMEKLK